MNKPLILVVEDDSSVKNLITTTLKAHDYRHLTAPNGQGCNFRSFFPQSGYCACWIWGLPDIDGVEVIKKIQYMV